MQETNNGKQIESNNLKIIKDQMECEYLLNKKYSMYSNKSNDAQIKGLCNQASEIHKNNFSTLKSYLDSHQ